MAITINIHPNPNNKDYDFHLPYVAGPTRNTEGRTRHGPEVFAEKVKELCATDHEIIFVNNGEPMPRLDQARLAIKKYVPNISVKAIRSNNLIYNKEDPIFKNKEYAVFKNILKRDLINDALDYYIKHNKDMTYYSERFYDRDQGFFEYGKMIWYNHGLKMPKTSNEHHIRLNHLLDKIWIDMAKICLDIFESVGLALPNLHDKLHLRIVHNKPQEDDEGTKFFKHLDGTLLTGWLAQRPTGAKIYQYTTQEKTYEDSVPLNVDDLYDFRSNDLLVMPGTAWCDYCQMDTPATWHEVSLPKDFKQQRYGMVFLLRNPEFEKTNYKF